MPLLENNMETDILKQNEIRDNLRKTIREVVSQEVADQLKGGLFTSRKLTDTPSDSLQVVNRKYVTLNGVSASRPTSSVLGQYYFDTTLGQPIWWDGISFVDASGNVV